jgi:hypothetical protein
MLLEALHTPYLAYTNPAWAVFASHPRSSCLIPCLPEYINQLISTFTAFSLTNYIDWLQTILDELIRPAKPRSSVFWSCRTLTAGYTSAQDRHTYNPTCPTNRDSWSSRVLLVISMTSSWSSISKPLVQFRTVSSNRLWAWHTISTTMRLPESNKDTATLSLLIPCKTLLIFQTPHRASIKL